MLIAASGLLEKIPREGEKMSDVYEKRIIDDIEAVQVGAYSNIGRVDKYPKKIACLILQKLLEWACQPQNATAIIIARNRISEIDKDWLKQYFFEVAEKCIDFSDDWEYRRLMELIICVIPELKEDALALVENSEDEDIQEVVRDYREL